MSPIQTLIAIAAATKAARARTSQPWLSTEIEHGTGCLRIVISTPKASGVGCIVDPLSDYMSPAAVINTLNEMELE
jgi:hypothetical protein